MVVFTSLLFLLPTHASFEVVEFKTVSDLLPPKKLVVLKSSDIDSMPMFGIKLNMTIQELLHKFPTDNTLDSINLDDYKKKETNLDDIFFVYYGISKNPFWNWLIILLENGQVSALAYLYMDMDLSSGNPIINNSNIAVKNVKPLFQQLRKKLGNNFEKKITYGEMTNERSAMYVWTRKKDVVAFTHSPITKYKEGGRFDYSLVIASKIENLPGLYHRMATNSLPEDALLWVDAMGDEANTDETNRVQTLVYVWIALVICFIPILYFTRKIILKK